MIFGHLIQAASSLPTDASALQSSMSALESAISALESDIKALENSLPWEYWPEVFTFLVFVGVALELWIIRHEYCDEEEEWALWHFFGVLRSPLRPSIGKKSAEVVSALLIAIGIAGELGVNIRIASINVGLRAKSAELRNKGDELRNKSNQLVSLVNGRAAKLEKEAKDESAKRVALQGQIVVAQTRVEELRAANNEAARNLEIEKLKRLKLALSQRDRNFVDQFGAIDALSEFPPMQVIFEYEQEGDERYLADQINFVVSELHWISWHRPRTSVRVGEGVLISTQEIQPLPPIRPTPAQSVASILKSYLEKGGVDTKVEDNVSIGVGRPESPSDTILIRIGHKSPSFEDIMIELGEASIQGLSYGNTTPISEGPPARKTQSNSPK